LSVLHSFEIELEPHATWQLCVDFAPSIDGKRMRPCHRCRAFAITDERQKMFLGEAARIETRASGTLAAVVEATLEQAKYDLAALRLYDLDVGERSWTMAAGLPIYIAIYGRDTLTASWQAAMLGTGMMTGTLDVLAKLQGTRTDWRLGHEMALCGRLTKGYGGTNERGKHNLLHVIDHLAIAPLPDGSPGARARAIAAAREAALADEAGTALDAALVRHGAPPRPVKAQPIRWMKRPASGHATRG